MREDEPVREEKQLLPASERTVKIFRRQCPICGTWFEGGPRKKYDRQACAVKAYEQRQGEAGVEARRDRQRRYQARRGGA